MDSTKMGFKEKDLILRDLTEKYLMNMVVIETNN